MMDKDRIAQIIREQGYSPDFRSQPHHSYRAQCSTTHTIYARAGRSLTRSLGSFEAVAQMTEEGLRTHIAARFAQASRRGRWKRGATELPSCAEGTMDENVIRAIIESCGYTMHTLERRKGNGAVRTYIYAAKGSVKHCLGNVRAVEVMSEEDLRTHIAARFAPSPVQRGRVKQ